MNCPTCNRPYGVRRRCYYCQPGKRRTRVTVCCAQCAAPFDVAAGRLAIGEGRYCSVQCAGLAKRADVAPRFWAKVDKSGECWVWTGARRRGYGQFSSDPDRRIPRGAHRVAWELTHGPIPTGMLVCHSCDNRPCVRPDHLFLGTQSDNRNDMYAKGRGRPVGGGWNRGLSHPPEVRAKMSAARTEWWRQRRITDSVSPQPR